MTTTPVINRPLAPDPPRPPGVPIQLPPRPCRNRQLVTCPTCGVELPGLLAGCPEAACLTAYLDDDAQIDARCDL